MKKPMLLTAILFSTLIFSQQKQLFNGENLEGWTIYGTEKWYVEDGLLICESGPDKGYGYLGTNDHYKNFEITLDFKQEANGNSGVFIDPLSMVQK
ncbi:3-keto-disaccharide hydrolase [Maribacter halichondriae]|uniref:3-keto-disaccharide hydrolase n=1 Tax=Maribacter halichondriae TaxID=2980554 RepID=UPI00235928DB|nr:DUF1080 domain-containing protein [Maribacter sp. Hal144]